MKICFLLLLLSLPALAEVDGNLLERVTGVKPSYNQEEKVYKLSFPRKDVPVQVAGRKLPPFMGLTSWAAFQPGQKSEAMMMGDLVLFQDEVNPAMDAAFASGLDVTALHNHFFYEDPRVFFMHIGGEGKAEQLAAGVNKILESVRQVRQKSPAPATSFLSNALPDKSSLRSESLVSVLGGKPAESEGMVKFTIGRKVHMSDCGCEVGKEMGINTWAAFYGSEEDAIVDGDFVAYAGELQPVLKTLRKHGISIVAIHSHMEKEEPRCLFLHYWGRGSSTKLAEAVQAALQVQKK